MNLDDALDRYLDHLKVERNVSAHTIAAYARDLTQLFRHLEPAGVTDPARVKAQHLTGFFLERARAGSAGRSRARTLSAVRGFFRFLVAEREIAADPTAVLESPRIARKLPEVLSLAGDYLGYIETSERMAEQLGETPRTYYGPELANRLGAALQVAAQAARDEAR